MGGKITRIFALLLVVFVTIGAQCVASCSIEQIAPQPPCHKSPVKSCAHDQAAGNSLKAFQVEAHAVAILPEAIEPLPDEAPVMVAGRPDPSPPLHNTVTSTVLRI